MAHSQEVRERARELRRRGLRYDEIAQLLSVSKSSVSLWTRDLPRPAATPEGVDARAAGLRAYFERRRQRLDAQRADETEAATAQIGLLSDREVLIAGAVAYWAEGTKSKPWRPSERITFTNSDPDMIKLFLAFVRLLGVDDDRIRLRMAIHESADVAAGTSYWADTLGVPEASFQRPTLKRGSARPGRKNVSEGYHGCLVVGVLRGASEYRQIEGMWRAIGLSASRLDRLSRVV
jgi:transcriptional regulator with XRE-family HTH domain